MVTRPADEQSHDDTSNNHVTHTTMAQATVKRGAMNEWEAEEILQQATELLDQHQLPAAEQLLHKVLTSLAGDSSHSHCQSTTALSALAQIYMKRSRLSRHNETEWYTTYMVAMGMEHLVVKHCEQAQEQHQDTRLGEELVEKRTRALNHLRVMEEKLIHLLEARLMSIHDGHGNTVLPGSASSLSLSRIPSSGSNYSLPCVTTSSSSFSLSSCQGGVDAWEQQQQQKQRQANPTREMNKTWLDKLHETCVARVQQFAQSAEWTAMSETPRSRSASDASSTSSKEDTTAQSKSAFSFGLRVDFKRVQKVIQKLVKQISQDLRQRYTRTRLPEEMLRQSLSTEMLSMLYPERDPSDIASLFEQALHEEDSPVHDDYTEAVFKIGDGTEEHVHSESADRSMSDLSNTWSCHTLNSQNSPIHFTRQNDPSSEDSESEYNPSCSAKKGTFKREGSYDFPGVLTVWRAIRPRQKITRPFLSCLSPYILQTFEELSPLTEIGNCQCKKPDDEKSEDDKKLYSSSPLNTDTFNFTFAYILSKLGDKLCDNGMDSLALELYKYVLGVYQGMGTCIAHQTERRSVGHLNAVACVVQNIGLMRCRQGDVVGGTHLLEEAMSLLEASGATEHSMGVQLVQLWLQLGNTLLSDGQGEVTVFRHVMEMIQEALEAEWHPSPEQEIDVDGDSSDSESDSGDVYCVNLNEAKSCYSHALAILQHLRHSHRQVSQSPGRDDDTNQSENNQDELQNSIYGDVLTRLADCSLMMGSFNKAVLYYEEALCLFRNSLGPTTLTNNAHVLVMLGMANFLLSNYPKAVSILETAHILHQHLYSDRTNLEMAFTLTMLGLAHHMQGQYYKSVAWCLKAFDCYRMLYDKKLLSVDNLYRWFVIQTVYVLGFSYHTLNLCGKALDYLSICEDILMRCPDEQLDAKQLVRVLKIKADVYMQEEDGEQALVSCQLALDYCGKLGDEQSANALQNQLLSCMADLHITSHEYSTAAQYLEQALTYQKTVEKSISGDLTDVVIQLAQTYTLSGDLDRAIQCYSECYETIKEQSHPPVGTATDLLGHLATLYHVKACMQDDDEGMNILLEKAEEHYQAALAILPRCGATTMYANFLYQQGRPADALMVLLPLVYGSSDKQSVTDMLWYGVQQAVLPDQVQQEVDDLDEVRMDTHAFACYLAVLCCNQLKLHEDGTDALVELYRLAIPSTYPLNHCLLGYALLETGLHLDAAESFYCAAQMQPENEVSLYNAWMSVALAMYTTFTLGVLTAMQCIMKFQKGKSPQPIKLHQKQIRDSGYYDNTEVASTFGMSLEPSADTQVGSEAIHSKAVDTMYTSIGSLDRGYTSAENLGASREDMHYAADDGMQASATLMMSFNESDSLHYDGGVGRFATCPDGTSSSSDTDTEWIVEEEDVVDTPAAVLEILRGAHSGHISAERDTYTLSGVLQQSAHISQSQSVTATRMEEKTPSKEYTHYSRNRNHRDADNQAGRDKHSRKERFEKSWHAEEMVGTPAVMMQHLNDNVSSNSREHNLQHNLIVGESNDNHADFSTDVSTTFVLDTSSMSHSQVMNNQTAKQSDSNESWQKWEETIETPTEVLQLIISNSGQSNI